METQKNERPNAFEELANAVENMTGKEYQLYSATNEFSHLIRACVRRCRAQGKSAWVLGLLTTSENHDDRPVELYANYGKIVAHELRLF